MNKQSITNSIKIPNKNLEILKNNFSHCFDKNGDFNFEKFKKELSENEEIDFSKESYGMDWLWKSYARLLASDEAKTLLKEDEDFNRKPENKDSQNLLIKGDNLEVLKHLSNAYYEKIKMIYIDPPYNTGSDGFVYQDDRKFTIQELSQLAGIDEEQAQRILDFTQSKSNTHSAWLTFMYPRLYIAKQLLKDDGVIFVSIDDNEVAQLRMLMDEIFGEENFVGEFVWIRKKKWAFLSKKTRKMTEYILCYQKEHNNVTFIWEKAYLDKQQPIVKRTNSLKTLNFPKNLIKTKLDDGIYEKRIAINNTNISFNNKFEVKNGIVINELNTKGRFVWTQGFLNKELKSGTQVFLSKQFGFNVLRHNQSEKTKTPSTMINKTVNVGTNEDASSEIASLFDTEVGAIFDYAKPTSLIKYITSFLVNQNDIILDFFAGSWTTGDAVMQLNSEDSGNRKYILVQIPEKIDPKKNKTAHDFVKNELKTENPTIFEITKERLIRAAKKIQETTKNSDKQTNKQTQKSRDTNLGFKIFETMPIWENYNLEAEEFDTQIKLFDENQLTPEDLKTILTTWKTYDWIPLTQNLEEINLNWYTGQYHDNKLYLINKNFKTKNLKKLLEEIDKNENFNPASIIVFGYNFESKTLREIADNVKNYTNKKQIDIDFITRY